MSGVIFGTRVMNLSEDDSKSVVGLLADLNTSYPDNTAVEILNTKNGDSVFYSAEQLVSDCLALCSVFMSMSLHEKTVAIVGKNSYNWLVSYLACACAGVRALIIDPQTSQYLMLQQMKLAEVKLIICDSKCIGPVPFVDSVITLDEKRDYISKDSISTLIKTGMGMLENGYLPFENFNRRAKAITHIAFDSGVYGAEKAVTLSSRNVYEQAVNAGDVLCSGKKVLITESFSNSRSIICALSAIAMGKCLCIGEGDVYNDAKKSNADLIAAPPIVIKEFYTDIWRAAQAKSVSGKLERYIRTSIAFSKAFLSFGVFARRFAEKELGMRVKRIVCFGSNIDEEILYGLSMLGIKISCVYEVPECGIITSRKVKRGRLSCFDSPIDSVFLKIDKAGQLLVRSDACMSGYLGEGNLPDYWVETGDKAEFLKNGRIAISNDPNEVVITEYGKRIFISQLSEKVKKLIPYASSIVIEAKGGGITLRISFDSSLMRISSDSGIRDLVEASVYSINNRLCRHELITDIVIENI